MCKSHAHPVGTGTPYGKLFVRHTFESRPEEASSSPGYHLVVRGNVRAESMFRKDPWDRDRAECALALCRGDFWSVHFEGRRVMPCVT